MKLGTQFARIGLALGATETTETDIGDIEVPLGATRITGISAACALETGTAGDGCVGYARLDYQGAGVIEGVPVDIVCMEELGGGYTAKFIDCNIGVTELMKVACYMTLSVAQGGACYGQVCLRFE